MHFQKPYIRYTKTILCALTVCAPHPAQAKKGAPSRERPFLIEFMMLIDYFTTTLATSAPFLTI